MHAVSRLFFFLKNKCALGFSTISKKKSVVADNDYEQNRRQQEWTYQYLLRLQHLTRKSLDELTGDELLLEQPVVSIAVWLHRGALALLSMMLENSSEILCCDIK